MSEYQFNLVNYDQPEPLADGSILLKRPFVEIDSSFEADAKLFVPGQELETAINTSIAVGEPLLLTGEPGTGKTQAGYYAAYKLGIAPVIHFQVKSDTGARDLLYRFDTVRYFHDAHFAKEKTDGDESYRGPLRKDEYVEPRALWEAMDSQTPRVLLIDEIDKAPRDFPNDLLHELDKMEFVVAETDSKVTAPRERRPLLFITSNSERRLPEPFLRRCVYHNIKFDDDLVSKAVEARREHYVKLSEGFLKLAIQRFLDLRDRNLRKSPSMAELLVWLRVLALATGTHHEKLDGDLSKLPYLGCLLKDHQDIEDLGRTASPS